VLAEKKQIWKGEVEAYDVAMFLNIWVISQWMMCLLMIKGVLHSDSTTTNTRKQIQL
jgi:hypothetical protein